MGGSHVPTRIANAYLYIAWLRILEEWEGVEHVRGRPRIEDGEAKIW